MNVVPCCPEFDFIPWEMIKAYNVVPLQALIEHEKPNTFPR